jgi:aldehyde dehydrogenase (NAD+)
VATGTGGEQRFLPIPLAAGANSTLLVLRDFDPGRAAEIAIGGMFNHAGQNCMANSRVVVEAPVFNDFCAALKTCCEAMHLGDLRDPLSAYGPLINRSALDRVQTQQEQALAAGAHLLTGGQVRSGLVYEPTVLLGTPPDSAAWREETPGPLMNLVAVSSLDEGIALANDGAGGLSAGVLTHNIQHGLRAARELNCGAVHVGMHSCQSNALAPSGRLGYSGVGGNGGRCSTEEFTRLKWISFEMDA